MKINRSFFLKILIIWLATSSLVIVILVNSLDTTLNLIILKDLGIYLIFLSSFFIYHKKYKFDFKILLFYVILLFLIFYNYTISSSSSFSKIAVIRQIITPFVLMFLGYQFIRRPEEYNNILRFIIVLSFFLILFGLFERSIHLWTIISLKKYFILKNIKLFDIGYPVMFIEPINLFQELVNVNGIIRVVSSFLDPINFGHFLVTVLTIVYYEKKLYKKKIRYFLLIIIFICLLGTFSKGAMLQLFLIFFILNKNLHILLKISSIIIGIIIIYLISLNHAGFLVHFIGFISVFNHLTLFGNGLATFGNYANMFAGEAVFNSKVGDSFWGSLIGQLGIIGFASWIFIFYKIIKKFPKNFYLSKILISQIIISALSENTFNLLSIFIIMFLIGGYYSINKKLQYKGVDYQKN